MRLFGVLIILTAIILTLASISFAVSNSLIQAKIYFDNKAQWGQIMSLHLDVVAKGNDYFEVFVNQDELTRIQTLGLKTNIIHDDVTAYYRSRMPDKSMGGYFTLDEIYTYLDTLIANHPTIVSNKVALGKTYELRDMWAVKISKNPNVDDSRPEVLYTAGIHAREVITPKIVVNFMNYLVSQYGIDTAATNIVDNRQLWFILACNPDGYRYNQTIADTGGGMWRKNRHPNPGGSYGVDINRNFGYEWGYDNLGSSPTPTDETYRGLGPFSELETQHMRDFITAHHFVSSIYFHSYSNLILWPPGYIQSYTPDQKLFSIMGDSIAAMNHYSPGPGWGLYVTNGDSDDWLYGDQISKPKVLAFTIECGNSGDGFWPDTSRISQLVSENLGPCLFMARSAGNPLRMLPPNRPTMIIADTVAQSSYNVSWSLHDTLNPPIQYELTELADFMPSTDSAASVDNWTNNGFSLSSFRYSSAPTSFYSGSGDNLIRYIQTNYPYRVKAGDSLKFMTWYYLEEDWDYGYAEISTDGLTFIPIRGNISRTTNPHGNNRGYGFTGMSSGWVLGLFDLSAYVGSDIYIRISYYTDQAVSYEGIYVDNINPVVKANVRHVFSGLTDTTKTFTGNGYGPYSYQVRAMDVDNQWSDLSALKQTYVKPDFIVGDANRDLHVNIADAVYLINFVFKFGPAPSPLQAGDANCDHLTNISDAVYLINYVFKYGPAPCTL